MSMGLGISAIRTLLEEVRAGLERLYGDRLAAVMLYGSYARGEASAKHSDVDVLVVLRGAFERREERKRTLGLVADLSLEYEVVLSLTFVEEAAFEKAEFSFYRQVRRDAVAL